MAHTNQNLSTEFDKFYAHVFPQSLQKLLDFRQLYPYKTIEAGGRVWRYIDTGVPAGNHHRPPLFLLAGATTFAEVGFQSIAHFALQRRVIAPDYPPMPGLKALFAGMMAFLDRLGVVDFDLMGGSYGGWLAQSLVRLYPDRVRRVVLTAIGPPNPENSQQLARMRPLFRLLPMGVVRGLLNRSFSRLDTTQEANPDMALVMALARETLSRLRREDLLALIDRLVDQTSHYTFSPDDLKAWPGRFMMVFGSEDPASPLEKRQAMQALYPQAQMVVFEGGQHGIALTHQEQYFAAIEGFLAES